jgi:hypothetical protein
MAEVCNCGTQLVEDALFCHRCGKPTRELVVPETIEPEAPPVVPALVEAAALATAAPPPSFHNPVATRIALAVAGVGTLLSFLPYINFLAAGFFAVFFYRRRTGRPLNVESGLRMGWMTGLIMFGIMALILTVGILVMRAAGGAVPVELRRSGRDVRPDHAALDGRRRTRRQDGRPRLTPWRSRRPRFSTACKKSTAS